MTSTVPSDPSFWHETLVVFVVHSPLDQPRGDLRVTPKAIVNAVLLSHVDHQILGLPP